MRHVLGLSPLLVFLFVGSTSSAEGTSPWSHESEVNIVLTSGNSQTETYGGKQTTSYKFDLNTLAAKAKYVQTRDSGTEKAKSWEASLRYEREFTSSVSGFISQLAESDLFAGFIQRNSTDLGAKYFIVKNESDELFSEFGYRYSFEDKNDPASDVLRQILRLAGQWTRKWSAGVSSQLIAEYLHNTKEAEDYLANGEASLSTSLSDIFSFKTGYSLKYQNKPLGGRKLTDTVFTTALVAKF